MVGNKAIARSRLQVATQYEREVVCMAATDSLLAVGSRNHVSFIDPRQARCLSSIAVVEHNQGKYPRLLFDAVDQPVVAFVQRVGEVTIGSCCTKEG